MDCMNLIVMIEIGAATHFLVGSVVGVLDVHTQGETVDEIRANLVEVIELLRTTGAFRPESECVATLPLAVG